MAKPLLRKAFVMSVNAGHEPEYERRHRPIWKELEDALKSHGVHNYSIFLDPQTRQLFGYVLSSRPGGRLPIQHPVHQRRQAHRPAALPVPQALRPAVPVADHRLLDRPVRVRQFAGQ